VKGGALLAGAAALAAVLFVLQWDADDPARAASGTQAAGAGAMRTGASGPPTAGGRNAGPGPSAPATRQQQLAQWQQRYNRAEQVYNSYRDATRYPPDSRPIDEHPDQVRPFEPTVEDVALRDASGKPLKGLRIQTTQDRIFVTGPESAIFTIQAFDESGRPVPLVVERSAAQSMPDSSALISLIRADVPFTDTGTGADAVAADGRHSARLAPASQGFANHAGTIRILVDVSANGQKGVVPFDVVYTPQVPATWDGGVREALEDGALNFYLKAQVKTAGRYVASARVYDAGGKPFALLQFNDTVAAGPAEFKLTLAGALVRDRQPEFPLQLVDVEGFLLKPDVFPDRAMMPRLAGPVHVSKTYRESSFSEREWQSEERARYLEEYGRDMQMALDAMARLR
jgi:hypothetical protein